MPVCKQNLEPQNPTVLPSWSSTVYLVACSKPRMRVPLHRGGKTPRDKGAVALEHGFVHRLQPCCSCDVSSRSAVPSAHIVLCASPTTKRIAHHSMERVTIRAGWLNTRATSTSAAGASCGTTAVPLAGCSSVEAGLPAPAAPSRRRWSASCSRSRRCCAASSRCLATSLLLAAPDDHQRCCCCCRRCCARCRE